ncbi:regulatory protein RecX [Sandaracinobacteroides hominis]|uniref:regulatory protein RecX n=1 Tax=Sandaracinobacteroides hominis TaxID=2780086 RepID=UPI001F417476|nr:regulatory protein RecX [Sandaracinobacteroides hominis]
MLDAIAVRYVERFQTTRARLVRLLRQKLRQRGWEEGLPAADPEAVAERMVQLGYVNDQAFAEARTRGLVRRGMGAGRVKQALAAYGVDSELVAAAVSDVDALGAAVDFAHRKRLGPFGPPVTEPKARMKQLGAMARAGHGYEVAKRVVDARSEEELED